MIGPSDRLTAGALRDSPHVLLVGDVMLDRYLVGAVERISPEAPVPVLHVQRSFNRPGGAGNVAVNMSAMGGRPTLLAAVGADDAGRLLAAALEADGVAGTGLVPSAATPTTVKTRLLAGHNQIARFDEESPLVDTATRDRVVALVREHIAEADVAVISDYAKGVCDAAVCRAVIEAARDRGIPVIVDPKGHDFSRYAGAAVLTPNRAETMAVVGFPIRGPDEAVRAGQILRRDHGIDAVVVTLGEQGMVVVAADGSAVIPTQARQVYDVTGAGDSAVATLAVALGRGFELSAACFLANAAAGLQVARVGTARITWDEMLAAIEQQTAISHRKVVSPAELQQEINRARAVGKRIGFTNGCFDILHHGHVALLEAAARECDLLVVGVNSDASVTRLKGAPRPFVPSPERQAVLAGLSAVAWVCEFDADTPLELITLVQPDVLVKGADYAANDIVGADIVRGRGGRVVTPLFVPDASTTTIVDRIRLSAADQGDKGRAP
jgi:D-beta-D-heptose 7-phosphate kinase/D-beta-D-heptose 1-phosphate adenosyltransferase